MKVAVWYLLAVLAVLADLAVFASPLPLASSNTAFVQLWGLHAGACAVLATCALALMPLHSRSQRVWTWCLLFCFSLAAPVLGPLCVVLITRVALRQALDLHHRATPQSVTLPEFEVRAHQVGRAGQAAIRSRLTPQVPAPVRMRSLLTLQAVPSRVANPILEGLLGDDSDDVRLVAFGMLDAGEKKISSHIHEEQSKLAAARSSRARYDSLRQLAELHWELVYAGLASGGLKTHNLQQARKYLQTALSMDEQHDSGILFLQGRILMTLGDVVAAAPLLQQALERGQSAASVLPYLAEMAFAQADFATVHAHMNALAPQRVASKTAAIVDLWTGRDSVLHFRDRRILEHI